MVEQITDVDIRRQVTAAVEANGPELAQGIDIDGIVREIVETYGLIDIEGWNQVTGHELIGFDTFWAIVARHDITQNEAASSGVVGDADV